MPIVVSDTSVLVDLERGALLEVAFALGHELAVPDLLYRQELAAANGEALRHLGLRVEELEPAEVEAAQVLRLARPKLSFPDAFAYSLATGRGWPLLTGDGELRSVCQQNEHPHHGLLWVCDQIHLAGVVPVEQLVAGLESIVAHPRCRLPSQAVAECLTRYQQGNAA